MKKLCLFVFLTSVSHTLFAQQDTKSRYGISGEVFGMTGKTVVLAGALEYKYTFAPSFLAEAHSGIAQVQIGLSITDNVQFLAGGGYEHNFSYERGQAFLSARINTGIVMASGKYLFANYGYDANYEASVILFLNQGSLGFGGFYQTEYETNVIGGKIVWRLGSSSVSSSRGSRSTRVCFLCR